MKDEAKRSVHTIRGVGVLLEDMSTQLSAVAEGVEENGQRMDRLEGKMGTLEGKMGTLEIRMGRLEERMTKLEAEIHSLRAILGTPEHPNIITRDEYHKLEERLSKVEKTLELKRAAS